jgi:hypothetical protein
MRRSSSGWIEVPVGLDGEASSTPRVFGPQCSSTLAALSWKRSCAVVGISTARAFGGAHELPVAGVARVRHQDLVAGLDQRQAGQLQGGRGAGRDDDAARRHRRRRSARRYQPLMRSRSAGRPVASVYCVRPARMARSAASCTSGGAVKSGSPMFRKIIGWSLRATSRASCAGGLGHFHHVEGLDAFGAPRRSSSARLPRRAVGFDFGGRSCGARPFSTALTYLWPSVPPNSLASSMHSLSTTRHGTSARAGTRRRRST